MLKLAVTRHDKYYPGYPDNYPYVGFDLEFQRKQMFKDGRLIKDTFANL